MQKICIPIFYLLFTVAAFSQKKLPNPKIGNNETEINLFNSWDQGRMQTRTLFGCEAIYRVAWRKFTKLGGGVLVAADQPQYLYEAKVKFYGAVFADITQFAGKRQLLSINGRIGHGIYKEKYEFDDSMSNGFNKWTAGMYYSIGTTYRIIVSKRILITTSVFIFSRSFRETYVAEYYSPPSEERYKDIEYYSGVGFRFGIVF